MAGYRTKDEDGTRVVTITSGDTLAELRQIVDTEWPDQRWSALTLSVGPEGAFVITGPGRRPARPPEAPARG